MSAGAGPSSHSAADTRPTIVVVGAGIAGLAAVNHLRELTSTSGSAAPRMILLEATERCGGLVGTEQIGGYLVDTGADSFLATKPAAINLCIRLGLEDQLQQVAKQKYGALVLRNGRPLPVPAGFALMAPSAIWPVLTSPILSWSGKLRLLSDLWQPVRPPADDESLASFVRRRFGREALERLVQPLVGGIYTSDPERLSLAATLPRFLEQEQQYGSLIRAARLEQRQARTAKSHQTRSTSSTLPLPTESQAANSGARYGQFAALRQGIGSLVSALETVAGQAAQVRLQTRVRQIHTLPTGGYRLDLVGPTNESGGAAETLSTIDCEGLILAVPQQVAGRLLSKVDFSLGEQLTSIESASSVIVVTGHALEGVGHPLNAYGLVIPEIERRGVIAVSFSSRKFPDRAPSGRVQLRTFLGGDLHPEVSTQSDDQVTETTLRELRELLQVSSPPDFVRVVRYPQAMPQYRVGHLQKVRQIQQQLDHWPSLALAGNGLTGVGLPDVIASGEAAAKRVFQALGVIAKSHQLTVADRCHQQRSARSAAAQTSVAEEQAYGTDPETA